MSNFHRPHRWPGRPLKPHFLCEYDRRVRNSARGTVLVLVGTLRCGRMDNPVGRLARPSQNGGPQNRSFDGRNRAVKPQAILPIVTYPDANSDAIAANAVTLAALLGADLHAVALHPEIPEVSSPLSRLAPRVPKLRVPELIREADALSRSRGEELLAKVGKEAAEKSVNLTAGILSRPLALLGEAAAAETRYFDVALLGWEAENPPPRLSRRQFSSARDDQPSCCPNSAKFIRLTMSLSHGTGAAWRRARLPTRRSSWEDRPGFPS